MEYDYGNINGLVGGTIILSLKMPNTLIITLKKKGEKTKAHTFVKI